MADLVITVPEPQATTAGQALRIVQTAPGVFAAELVYVAQGRSFTKRWDVVPAGAAYNAIVSLFAQAVPAAKTDATFWPGT